MFGFSTDTMDVLGLIEDPNPDGRAGQKGGAMDVLGNYKKKDFEELLKKFEKTFKQKYPRFSSKTVNGRPLFEISKEEGISDDDIPEKEVRIKKIDFQSFGMVSKKYLIVYLSYLPKILQVRYDLDMVNL